MPLQNRVSPAGEIFADPARGTFMGNRGGAIHDDQRRIVRQYASRRWIACVLEFRGRRRTVMSPGRYTELFFLDEAVALAAGHRPCAECRRQRFNAFKDAWLRSGNPREGDSVFADAIDAELHPARIGRRREKVTYRAALKSLPDGCFVRFGDADWLRWEDALFRWSPAVYVEKRRRVGDSTVTVLTPLPIVRCLATGYRPEIHSSVREL
jgi:hypothetical protein